MRSPAWEGHQRCALDLMVVRDVSDTGYASLQHAAGLPMALQVMHAHLIAESADSKSKAADSLMEPCPYYEQV